MKQTKENICKWVIELFMQRIYWKSWFIKEQNTVAVRWQSNNIVFKM